MVVLLLVEWLHSDCVVACRASSTVVVLLLVELAPQWLCCSL